MVQFPEFFELLRASRFQGPIYLQIEYNRGGAISRSATTNFCKRRIATCNSLSVCFGAESLLPQRHHRLDLHCASRREIAGSGGNRGQHRGNGNERQRIGGGNPEQQTCAGPA